MRMTRRSTRRLAAALAAVAAVLLAVHFAGPAPMPGSTPASGHPAAYVLLRGQVTSVSAGQVTVAAQDQEGQITRVKHTVAVTSATRIVWPSAALGGPAATGRTLTSGLHVTVKAHALASGGWAAETILVSYPPLDGTVVALAGHRLTVKVAGQTQPVVVLLTSRTAFYVPGGQWGGLAAGAPVRVFVRPASGSSGWQATSVVVGPSPGGS